MKKLKKNRKLTALTNYNLKILKLSILYKNLSRLNKPYIYYVSLMSYLNSYYANLNERKLLALLFSFWWIYRELDRLIFLQIKKEFCVHWATSLKR